jgi:hypothetical protein
MCELPGGQLPATSFDQPPELAACIWLAEHMELPVRPRRPHGREAHHAPLETLRFYTRVDPADPFCCVRSAQSRTHATPGESDIRPASRFLVRSGKSTSTSSHRPSAIPPPRPHRVERARQIPSSCGHTRMNPPGSLPGNPQLGNDADYEAEHRSPNTESRHPRSSLPLEGTITAPTITLSEPTKRLSSPPLRCAPHIVCIGRSRPSSASRAMSADCMRLPAVKWTRLAARLDTLVRSVRQPAPSNATSSTGPWDGGDDAQQMRGLKLAGLSVGCRWTVGPEFRLPDWSRPERIGACGWWFSLCLTLRRGNDGILPGDIATACALHRGLLMSVAHLRR